MASLKTDVLSALPATTSLQDTDLIPVGTGSGATLKKMTGTNLKKALFGFSGAGYVLLEATTVNVTAPSTAAGKSTSAVTATFTKNANADQKEAFVAKTYSRTPYHKVEQIIGLQGNRLIIKAERTEVE